MKIKIATIFVLATLIAYAVADRSRSKTHKDYENDGYLEIEDDPADGSNEGDASVSENSGCGKSIDKSYRNEDYGRDMDHPYEKDNHRRNGYTSKASSAASADASANAYERGHTNRPTI